MSWHGEFAFGPAALVFRGQSAENRFHAHAAMQCVFSPEGTEVRNEAGQVFCGPGWLVSSGVAHCLAPASRLILLLVEPQSPLGRGLARFASTEGITALPPAVEHMLRHAREIERVLPELERCLAEPFAAVDRRLMKAIEHLDMSRARDPAVAAADHAGLSPSRLRALCRAEFGVPFSKVIVWRKVRRACLALSQGHSLAEAAHAAGFADQAHLTRTMSEVVGLTPGSAAGAAH